jgi:hypothetical protein
MTEHNLPEKDDAPWLNTRYDGFMTHEEMLEEAARREAIVAKVSEEDYQKVQKEVANKKALEAVKKLYAENGDALKELADIEKEERMDAVRTAIVGIDKYSDALKELSETEKVELRAELEKKKKENFQLVSDACMKEYEQKYNRDVFPVDEYWVYMLSEYGATGEGNTVCIMMTQAIPYGADFSEENRYVPINSQQYRAVRAFHEQFGTWHLHGLRFLSKEDFFTECAYYIPPVMMKLSNKNCFKEFHTKVHYNFS